MNRYPKISIVTPNLNGAKHLEKTMLSVLGQEYPNLEYMVIDGGSADGSQEIIRRYEDQLTFWESTSDAGMYHAVQKGFARCTGDIMAWINSDDIYLPGSLFTVADIFSGVSGVHWLQGYPVVIDEEGRLVYSRPAIHSKWSFLLGDYRDGSFIQQESSFWSRELWERSGGALSEEFRLAGDFELWMRFFREFPMHCTPAVLGAFRYGRGGQISGVHYREYLDECHTIVDRHLATLCATDRETLRRLKRARNFSATHPFLARLLGKDRLNIETTDPPRIVTFNFGGYRFEERANSRVRQAPNR